MSNKIEMRALEGREIDAVAGGVWAGPDGQGCIRLPHFPWLPTIGSTIRRVLGWLF
ncbi:MAG: hypothetical protein AB7O57_04095 [Hyphomicrobiaceae bacterium]